ncbi:unnamed protein product, partial [Trichogramma brassicae]
MIDITAGRPCKEMIGQKFKPTLKIVFFFLLNFNTYRCSDQYSPVGRFKQMRTDLWKISYGTNDELPVLAPSAGHNVAVLKFTNKLLLFATKKKYFQRSQAEGFENQLVVIALLSIVTVTSRKLILLSMDKTNKTVIMYRDEHQMILHEGRKDYACDKCDKKFGQNWHLLYHQKTVYEGRKDYACKKCEIKFGEKSNLSKHQRTSTRKLQ